MMEVGSTRGSWQQGPVASQGSPRLYKQEKLGAVHTGSLQPAEASLPRFEDSLDSLPAADSVLKTAQSAQAALMTDTDGVPAVTRGDEASTSKGESPTYSLNIQQSCEGQAEEGDDEDGEEEDGVMQEDGEEEGEAMEEDGDGDEQEEEQEELVEEGLQASVSSGTLTAVSLEVEESPADSTLVSTLLRPLSAMSREELVQVCGNLEVALTLKDREMATVHQQYEHLLGLYYETADTLAQRNSELLLCQGHLREAQACLRQWKTEILDRQDLQHDTSTSSRPDKSRGSIVSDSVLLETRAQLVALAGDCGVEDAPGSKEEGPVEDHLPPAATDEDCKQLDLHNPKRVSRRMMRSLDFKGRSRITPVLHRRRSAKAAEDSIKPVPKPRQSVQARLNTAETRNQEEEEEEEAQLTDMPQDDFSRTFAGQGCEDTGLFGGTSLSASMPVRMSYSDASSHVDILRIETDSRPNSTGSASSEDTLTTDRTVIERGQSSERGVSERGGPDEGLRSSSPEQGRGDAWSTAPEGRPRTSCGRPLTGERRPNLQTDDRPPTRSGPVAASYSFEGRRGSQDHPQPDNSSTGTKPQRKTNGSQRGEGATQSDKTLTSKSMNFTPTTKPKHRIIFKEIKNTESSMVFPRPQTPHVRPRNKVPDHEEKTEPVKSYDQKVLNDVKDCSCDAVVASKGSQDNEGVISRDTQGVNREKQNGRS